MNNIDTVIGRLNKLRWMWNNGEPINGIILERIEETITTLREQQSELDLAHHKNMVVVNENARLQERIADLEAAYTRCCDEASRASREAEERIAHLEMANRAAQGCALCNFAERDACVEIRQKAERQRDAALEALEYYANADAGGAWFSPEPAQTALKRIRGMK